MVKDKNTYSEITYKIHPSKVMMHCEDETPPADGKDIKKDKKDK